MAEAAEKEELEIIETEDDQEEAVVADSGDQDNQEEASASADDEIANYSESVQRRIKTLTGKYREEERQRQAALEYAEAVKKQNDELKSRLDKLDQSYVGEFGTRIESQIDSAKQAYQKAYDDGDAEAMFEAQKNLSRLALDQAKLDQARQRHQDEAAYKEQAQSQPVQQATEQATQQAAPPPDPKAEAWATKNNWFGQDQTMTYAAFGIHRQLIEDEGFDPTSDEYYTELDRRVRTEFPHKFKEATRNAGPRVASAESTASKSSSKGRRTVKLTSSQIAIAKRLNVPLEEYAKYVKE